MQYGLMVNTPTAGSPAAVYYKTDSTTFLTSLASIATPTTSPVNTAKLTNTASQTVPFGGNHSLQIRFDGTNMFFYVDGSAILPTTTLAGQTYTFAPTNKGPYYLVMSFANSNQFSSVPSGLLAPPTNFDLQVTMNDLFTGPSIVGTAIQIQQYIIKNPQTFPTAVAGITGVNTPSMRWTIDTPNSSSASEISYVDTATPAAAGIFTYTAIDGSSKAMVNLIVNIFNTGSGFFMRYVVFPGQPALTPGPRTVGPWIQSQTTSLTMKVSFLMTHLDSFIVQMYGTAGTLSGTLVIEKLPVASGGGQEGGGSGLYRNIQVYPIPKRGKHNSLRVRKASTKAGTKKKNK
jgi:hypothetical protein